MGDGALGSDHINYLILRYLQEAGHENAAKALHQDWHRPQEFRDPEQLPFAPLVKQYELVHIIQDAIFHDQLLAHVTNQSRRFNLTAADDQSAHRVDNNTRRDSDQNDFPLPPAKRPRIANDDTNHHDAMHIDSTPQDDHEDAEREPTVDGPEGPEPEPIVTISSATQTDKKLKSRSETMYWALDQPDASIMHALWNPHLSQSTRLLTVGESLCRFYDLPHQTKNGLQRAIHTDAETMPKGSVITAACWHPSGRYATCALDSTRQLPGGGQESVRSMFDATVQGTKRFYDLHGYLLQQSAMVVSLRYNYSGERLLSVSTNMKRGLVEVWHVTQSTTSLDPVAVKLFNQPVLDAVWTFDDSIIVCGQNRLDEYQINHSPLPNGADVTADSFASTGTKNFALRHSHPTDKQWDKVRYDSVHNVIIATSSSDDCTIMLAKTAPRWVPLSGFPTDGPASKRATAMAFQPLENAANNADAPLPRRLAVTHNSGLVRIYQLTSTLCEVLHEFTMGPHEAALALSWSPTGSCLAVASEEAVKIWDLNSGSVPLLTWRAAATHWYQGDENNLPNGDETGDEPSLSWDAEGKRLIFAVGRKVSLDNFEYYYKLANKVIDGCYTFADSVQEFAY
jgi:WD40 repeat protein